MKASTISVFISCAAIVLCVIAFKRDCNSYTVFPGYTHISKIGYCVNEPDKNGACDCHLISPLGLRIGDKNKTFCFGEGEVK